MTVNTNDLDDITSNVRQLTVGESYAILGNNTNKNSTMIIGGVLYSNVILKKLNTMLFVSVLADKANKYLIIKNKYKVANYITSIESVGHEMIITLGRRAVIFKQQ